MNDPQHMIAAYFEGTLSADQVAELEAWLRQDRARALAYVREAMLDCHLAELLREENLEHVAADLSHDSQFGALLTALDAPEGSTELVKITEQPKPDRPAKPNRIQANDQANPISAREFAIVGGYLLRQALTSKPAILACAAAIALLAAVLLIPRLISPDPQTAQQPPAITQPATPPATPVVATLTATHNAQWAEGALAPGTKLHADQTLTLTTGFAEITTNRGAVVILEAPATVELLDNDNAIRLHTGKLVGICETESSKGFMLRTPRMDLRDLGTRFGLAVDQAGGAFVEVFDGSVEVSTHADAAGGARVFRMESGNRIAVDQAGARVDPVVFDPELFANLIAQTDQANIFDGITFLSSDLQWVEKDQLLTGVDRALLRSDKAWVCLEVQNYTLAEDLPTTAFEALEYNDLPEDRFGVIPAGTRIRSYLIGYQRATLDGLPPKGVASAQGRVIFHGQILGVIANYDHWHHFDHAVYGDRANALVPVGDGMLLETRSQTAAGHDSFTIRPFKHKLDVHLKASTGIDMLRVLVLETETP